MSSHLRASESTSSNQVSSCLLEIGIFLSHLIWLARTRKIRMHAAAEGKMFDDVAAEHAARGTPFEFAERKGRKQGGYGVGGKRRLDPGWPKEPSARDRAAPVGGNAQEPCVKGKGKSLLYADDHA